MEGAGEEGEEGARRQGPGSRVEVVGAQAAPEAEGEQASSRVEVAEVCCLPTREVGEEGHQAATAPVWAVGVVAGCCR